jgi:hypothetical protein
MSRGNADNNEGGGRYIGHPIPGAGHISNQRCHACKVGGFIYGNNEGKRRKIACWGFIFECNACLAKKVAA